MFGKMVLHIFITTEQSEKDLTTLFKIWRIVLPWIPLVNGMTTAVSNGASCLLKTSLLGCDLYANSKHTNTGNQFHIKNSTQQLPILVSLTSSKT